MSLPPNFVDELRTRLSLAQVVGRKVVWDARKSNPGKGDMWAPCPFHQEKSASFHVDDRKGYYYCFGCHAKGDAISFVRETENVGFMEAVEILAREAGMPMPARDPVAAQRADRRSELTAVMEQAVQHYRMMLNTSAAADARAYLDRRKLDQVGRDRFEIGFAPDTRQGLYSALTAKGVAPDLLIEAGLCAKPDDGGAAYDRFRGRIMFPIRDGRGRAIGFGGRAMDANAKAKYYNSPETPLFDKGRNLYNHGPAREAAGKGQPLIVAEGYMDVIALVQAGFTGAVAPLGTAVTEDQLRLMWRIHPEPVIALDGDAAGIRAALRVIDLALPLLEAGNGLRFALMPHGQDPDDVIRSGGRGAMEKLLADAQPMVRLLWQRETEGKIFDSPERKAALDKTLRAAIKRIADPSIRAHYGEAIRSLRQELFGGAGARQRPRGATSHQPRRGTAWQPPAVPMEGTRNSLLAQAEGSGVEDFLREATILAICALHPVLIAQFESALERVDFATPDHDHLRGVILSVAHVSPETAGEKIRATAPDALEKLLALSHVAITPPVRNTEDTQMAMMCLAEELAKLSARRGARAEIEDAAGDMDGLADEGVTWRLREASQAVQRAQKPRSDDVEDAGEDRESLSKTLQNMIDSQVWVKNRG